MLKKCIGHCPKCNSNNLEYGNTELDGNSMGYEFECRDCGCEGIEWYDCQYACSSYTGWEDEEDDE